MKKIVFVLIFVISTVFSASLPKGDIKGKIVDAETKQPLIGANIIISGTAKGTSTDAEGNYSFNLVDVGTYVIEYSYIGYDKITKTDVIVRPDRTTYLNVSMRSSTLELENVVVSGGYFSESDAKPISSVNFSAEEIRRAPGSAGDVSRIVYGLPALAKVNDQRNSLIVRGGSPVENSFYLDNIEIPNISHFPVEGSSDGPIGILNTDFIEDVNFNTGGFSPVYGDRLSSIMEISYREGNSDKFEPQLNLNLAGFGGLVEGPIGSNGNYMFAVNRSYLDLIISKDETGGAIPHYGDAQGKVVYNIDEKNKISLLGVFSIDEINLEYEDAVKTDLTNYYGSTDGIFNVAGLNWQHIYGKSGYSNTSIAHTFSKYDRSYSETKSQRHLFRNRSIENTIALRNVNYLKLNESNSIEFGVEGKLYLNNFDILFNEWQDHYGNIKPALIIDNNFNSFKTGIFALHSWQLMKKLRFEYGGRLDFFEYNGNVNVSPRASLIYDFTDITSLTASAGIFRQEIPNYLMIQNSNFKNLKTPYSAHYILGLSHLLTESTRLTIETYYKDYKYFPVDPDQPNIFLFDESMVDGLFLQHEKLVDDGKGYSIGTEVMIQKKTCR